MSIYLFFSHSLFCETLVNELNLSRTKRTRFSWINYLWSATKAIPFRRIFFSSLLVWLSIFSLIMNKNRKFCFLCIPVNQVEMIIDKILKRIFSFQENPFKVTTKWFVQCKRKCKWNNKSEFYEHSLFKISTGYAAMIKNSCKWRMIKCIHFLISLKIIF